MDSSSLEKYLFGPLDQKYCVLFYFFAVVMFVSMAIGVVGLLFTLYKKRKLSGIEMSMFAHSFMISFISYLTYRLIYSMCISSVKTEEGFGACDGPHCKK